LLHLLTFYLRYFILLKSFNYHKTFVFIFDIFDCYFFDFGLMIFGFVLNIFNYSFFHFNLKSNYFIVNFDLMNHFIYIFKLLICFLKMDLFNLYCCQLLSLCYDHFFFHCYLHLNFFLLYFGNTICYLLIVEIVVLTIIKKDRFKLDYTYSWIILCTVYIWNH
jgi:hypothetical protein